MTDTTFDVSTTLFDEPGRHGRTGTIHTPHGDIQTPAFIPVATKATVKMLTPEQVRSVGAQAILSNAYHLYLQPGPDIVDEAGGVAAFENWHGPTYTDSGGFQVMSLGVGFKKVLAMDVAGLTDEDIRAANKERMARVDDDGVDFKSFIDGSTHRFTPEVSMQIQHQLGADIMFAFDELTTLVDTRAYQEHSVERTHQWARRCLLEHERLTQARPNKPLQSLWGVVQGAQYGICADKQRVAFSPWMRKPALRAVVASVVLASAARLRRRTWAPSSAGSPTSCLRISPATCWGSLNPMICSPPSRPAPTLSTALPPPALAAAVVCTPWTAV